MEPKIQTRSGGVIHFDVPDNSVYTLDDIAHGLSNACRYGGQCEFFYSVAQHAVMFSYMVSERDALAALHHDDTEAFMCDLPTPLKMLVNEYMVIEMALHDSIFDRLGLPRELSADVKYADACALALEKPILIGASSIEWKLPSVESPSWDDFRAYIKPMTPDEAKRLWLARHQELCDNLGFKTKSL